MKSTFVSNSTESSRMFKANWMEALSKVHYSVPLFVFVPVIGFFGWKGWVNQNGTSFALSMVGGLLLWTLAEYVLHRFIFHYAPKSSWGQRLHFIFHGVHHDFPNDANRLVLPPSVSIPLATGFYFLFAWLLPEYYLYSFFAAFVTGYLCYDMSHYALHHATFKSALWKRLKHHHMTHHYSDATRGFGLTSPLWDKILGSDFEVKGK